jgi:murein DD-endopeptidase MepM/ murein hydrolase activator NlpD
MSSSLPFPHRNNSFSYKTIDPRVRAMLLKRSLLNNTTQVGMPFIKVTSTLDLPGILGADNWGFTLGIHSTPEDLKYRNIYSNKSVADGSNLEYLIGYTYNKRGGETTNVYTKTIDSAEPLIELIDVGGTLVSGLGTNTFAFVPPPGITGAKISRNRDGRVAIAHIDFTVPTLPQLEMLHRTFLVPGMGMIVEWGQQYAPRIDSAKEDPLSPEMINSRFFPWHRSEELPDLFKRLGNKQVGIQEILENYTYPSEGKYTWMYGNVANFSVKGNADGSFNCQVRIIGPHEDSWAYNVINTVVPVRGGSGEICPQGVYSVSEYLTGTSDALNLKTLLQKVYNETILPDWRGHVVRIENGNRKDEGEGDLDAEVRDEGVLTLGDNNRITNTSAIDAAGFGEDENAYYMTWRFFVNVVLNDPDYGIKAIFRSAGMTSDEINNIGLLRPYKDLDNGFNVGPLSLVNDPYESFVGNNRYLRSIDISSLVIVNETAVRVARTHLFPYTDEETLNSLFGDGNSVAGNTPAGRLIARGDFHETGDVDAAEGQLTRDKGLLSTGVWLNHKAVVETMVSSNTILGGISNLLQRMNSATSNYWNLMIDDSPPTRFEGIDDASLETETQNYVVVDASYYENAEYALKNFLNDVYVFNKYIRNSSGGLVGSELIESNVELSLPQTLFAQIATLGLVQREDIAQGEAKDALTIGVNDTLRKMFAITSLYGSDDNIPDLTKQKDPGVDRTLLVDAYCGGTLNRTENSETGVGSRVSNQQPSVLRIPVPTESPTLSDLAGLDRFGGVARSSAINATSQRVENILDSSLCRQECLTTTAPTPLVPTESASESLVLTLVNGVPMTNPTRGVGPISSPYGVNRAFRGGEPHKGIDIAMPVGTAIYAAHSGKIKTAQNSTTAGNFIEIVSDQNNQITTRYLHLQAFAVGVGNDVTRGQLIGYSGDTGVTTGPHLHFEIRQGSPAINATTLIDLNPDALFTTNATNPRSVSPTASQYLDTLECVPCRDAEREIQRAAEQARQEDRTRLAIGNRAERALRRFNNLRGILRYNEIMPDIMVSRIARDSNGNESNAFGAAPGTLAIKANMKMPGIAGLRVGELFWIDRMPLFYRAFGAFQTMTIEDDITISGWTTSVSARFNYLGAAWKQSVVNLIRSGQL